MQRDTGEADPQTRPVMRWIGILLLPVLAAWAAGRLSSPAGSITVSLTPPLRAAPGLDAKVEIGNRLIGELVKRTDEGPFAFTRLVDGWLASALSDRRSCVERSLINLVMNCRR